MGDCRNAAAVPPLRAQQVHWILAIISLALVGCADRTQSQRHVSESALPRVQTAQRDSTWIEVRGPTLIGFVPANADAAVITDPDLGEALDDFEWHLRTADSTLRNLGFRITVVGGRRFYVVRGARVDTFTVPKDSADIGYYMVAPRRAAAMSYGVLTNSDLVEEARTYLQASTRDHAR